MKFLGIALLIVSLPQVETLVRADSCNGPTWNVINKTRAGLIESPHYPYYYGQDTKTCTTIIDLEPGEEVELKMTELMLCNGHYLRFYESMDTTGEHTDNAIWAQRHAWTNYNGGSPSGYTSFYKFKGDVKVEFTKSNTCENRGFQLYWRIIPLEARYFVRKANLKALWPMTYRHIDGTVVQDISGNDAHGVKGSNIVTAIGPSLKAHTSLRGSGGDGATQNFISFLSAETVAKLDVGDEWTLCGFWRAASGQGGQQPFINFEPTNSPRALHVYYTLNNDIYVSTQSTGSSTASGNTGSWHPTANMWYYLCFSYDKVAIKLHQDSILRMTLPATTTQVRASSGFKFFKHSDASQAYDSSVSCWSFYDAVLTVDEMIQTRVNCHKIMEGDFLDETKSVSESTCNFDYGWCGWTQYGSSTTNDWGWKLQLDDTTRGMWKHHRMGPPHGHSAEALWDRDYYAVIDMNAGYVGQRAQMVSPMIAPGRKCFSMSWMMYSYYANYIEVFVLDKEDTMGWLWKKTGRHGQEWQIAAVNFEMDEPFQIAIAAAGSGNYWSESAVDNIKITEGYCGSQSTPCPDGWKEFGYFCWYLYPQHRSDIAQGQKACRELKAERGFPESLEEETWIMSTFDTGNILWLGGYLTSSKWYTDTGRLIWASGNTEPLYKVSWTTTNPGLAHSSLRRLANKKIEVFNSNSNIKPLCRITKLEAEYRGFNCTFDGKHTCGWRNLEHNDMATDGTPGDSGSYDMRLDAGPQGLRYAYTASGPKEDFTLGGLRGYYIGVDAQKGHNQWTHFRSPIVHTVKKPQCFSFRVLKCCGGARYWNIYLTSIKLSVNHWPQKHISAAPDGNYGSYWLTEYLDIYEMDPYILTIHTMSSGGADGDISYDDFKLTDGFCKSTTWQVDILPIRNNQKFEMQHDGPFDNNFNLNQWNSWYNTAGDNGQWSMKYHHSGHGYLAEGPMSDHTGPYRDYRYAYVRLYHASQHARLESVLPGGVQCLTFWYHMSGVNIGQLRVQVNDRWQWALSGNQGPYGVWTQAKILLNGEKSYKVGFEATGGTHKVKTENFDGFRTIAIDDIKLTEGQRDCIGTFDCNFEGPQETWLTGCGWRQNDTDNADWERGSRETPAGNSFTGPLADTTFGDGHYMYFEATGQKEGAKAKVKSPPLPAGEFCMMMRYHMWGANIGSLRAYYERQDHLKDYNNELPPYEEIDIWRANGNQGNVWRLARIPFNLNFSQQITLEATRGNGDSGDIAVDDISIIKGACQSEYALGCNFDAGVFCSLTPETKNGARFEIVSGRHGDVPGDTSGVFGGGKYLLLKHVAKKNPESYPTGPKDCRLTKRGLEYAGTVSTTVTGRTCQKWNVQSPHAHGLDLKQWYTGTMQDRSNDHNYCRTRNDPEPWCYTTDPGSRWEYCSQIPLCSSLTWKVNAAVSTVTIKAPGHYCLSFDYFRQDKGDNGVRPFIDIFLYDDVYTRLTGEDTKGWQRFQASIYNPEQMRFKIRASTSSKEITSLDEIGDLAIDNIQIVDGNCQGEKMKDHVHTQETFLGWRLDRELKNHVLLETTATTKYGCVSLCGNHPGCKSINYLPSTKKCELNDQFYLEDMYNVRYLNGGLYWDNRTWVERMGMTSESSCTYDMPNRELTTDCKKLLGTNDDISVCKTNNCRVDEHNRYVCDNKGPATSCKIAYDCDGWYQFGFKTSGRYLIQPGVSSPRAWVRCIQNTNSETTTSSRGFKQGVSRWTYRKFDDFDEYFGDPDGDYFIGNQVLYNLINGNSDAYHYKTKQLLTTKEWYTFPWVTTTMGDKSTNWKFGHGNRKFYTYDNDSPTKCATTRAYGYVRMDSSKACNHASVMALGQPIRGGVVNDNSMYTGRYAMMERVRRKP